MEQHVVPEWEHFLHFVFSANTVVIVAAGIYWHIRRKHKPLTARVPLLMYSTLLGLFIQNAMNWTSVVIGDTKVGTFFMWLALPLVRDPYVWRVFQLFFLYQLTDQHIKSVTVVSDDNSKSDKKNKGDWYSRHQHLVKDDWMMKSFVIFHVVYCLVMGGLSLLLVEISHDVAVATWLLRSIEAIYIFLALALVILIRKVQDAFFLKREFLAVAFYWLFENLLILVLTVPAAIAGSKYYRFGQYMEPFFLVLFSYAGPIAISYTKAFRRSISTDPSNSSPSADEEKEHKVAEYKSLDSILSNAQLAQKFINEARKHFSVQMIFFLQQLNDWKSLSSEQKPGKALLLYQKFIKPMSLLDMNVPEDVREGVEKVLLDEDKLLSAKIDDNFFDDIETYVRNRLDEPLRYFKHSPEYAKCLSEILEGDRLYTGMKQVGMV